MESFAFVFNNSFIHIHTFINSDSFNQHILIEYLPCFRYSYKRWSYSSYQNTKIPAFMEHTLGKNLIPPKETEGALKKLLLEGKTQKTRISYKAVMSGGNKTLSHNLAKYTNCESRTRSESGP